MGVLIRIRRAQAHVATRKEIRARYRICADQYDDHFASLFCHTCALTQERREIELEEGSFS